MVRLIGLDNGRQTRIDHFTRHWNSNYIVHRCLYSSLILLEPRAYVHQQRMRLVDSGQPLLNGVGRRRYRSICTIILHL